MKDNSQSKRPFLLFLSHCYFSLAGYDTSHAFSRSKVDLLIAPKLPLWSIGKRRDQRQPKLEQQTGSYRVEYNRVGR